MRKIDHSNVRLVTTVLAKNLKLIIKLQNFMRGLNHLNVEHVIIVLQGNLTLADILLKFMEERNHFNVIFVSTGPQENFRSKGDKGAEWAIVHPVFKDVTYSDLINKIFKVYFKVKTLKLNVRFNILSLTQNKDGKVR